MRDEESRSKAGERERKASVERVDGKERGMSLDNDEGRCGLPQFTTKMTGDVRVQLQTASLAMPSIDCAILLFVSGSHSG